MNVIGLDIGTTSISAALFDTDSKEVKDTRTIAHKSFLPAKEGFERMQDPAIIMNIVLGAADELIDSCPDVSAIGLTGQMHGILYVDADGQAISPLFTWQDGRGNALGSDGKTLCQELKDRYQTNYYTGYGLITHIYNLRHGLVPEGAAKLCTIMDYLGMKLTGRCTPLMHSSDAASLGFYDIEAASFQTDILEAEGVDISILPEISSSIEILGSYRSIPVTVAIGDNQASFIGSVEHAEEEVLVNMGTGGQVSVYSDIIVRGENIETRPLLEDSYIIVGSSLCGGRSYAMLADFFRSCADWMGIGKIDIYSVMDKMLSSCPSSKNLKIDTAFSGTRDNPSRTGSITGITPDTFTPEALTRGMVEGMASELYKRYSVMQQAANAHHTCLLASGNGFRKNKHLQESFSKTFGMQLTLSDLTEEAACGTAIAASTALGGKSWRQVLGL